MTTTTEAVIPALRDVRDAEGAVVDTFQAHIAVTPAGEHRHLLERHVKDTRRHLHSLDQRLEQLQPTGLLPGAIGRVRGLAGQAVRAARLPWEVVMAVPAAALAGVKSPEHTLLKNAENEYALTAKALATSRAGEHIAREADDGIDANLLATIRTQDQEFLEELGRSLDASARAAVGAAASGRSRYRAETTGAAEAIRGGGRHLRDVAAMQAEGVTEAAAGAVGRIPAVSRIQGELKGAVAEEGQLPIPDYGDLTAAQIIDRLPRLSQADLAVIDGYERAEARRTAILNKIAELRQSEPWPGYDAMATDEIRTRLREAGPALARNVVDYERRHQGRTTVITAAERAGSG